MRMRTLRFLMLLCAAGPLFSQDLPPVGDPAQVLLNLGTKDETAGQLERAKLAFSDAGLHVHHQFADRQGSGGIGRDLYVHGRPDPGSDGKTQSAYDTFRTLMRVYPESPLAKLADETAKSLAIPPNPRRSLSGHISLS
jgi:hypothetical protein